MPYQIINKTKNKILADKACVADTFFKRLAGLMGKKQLPKDEALIFYKAGSIHTLFMRFAIDVVFLDRDFCVLRVVKNLTPWRVSFCMKSFVTIEFTSSSNIAAHIEKGDCIEIKEV